MLKEDAQYLAVNMANTFMSGKIGNKEDLIEEYMELYYKAISHNIGLNSQFVQNKITEEIAHYLATNIANTFMSGKIGNKEDLIEEYMNVYTEAISFNMKGKSKSTDYFSSADDLEESRHGRSR